MSIPVKACVLAEAIKDEEAFVKIAPTMQKNLNGGHFTVLDLFQRLREFEPQNERKTLRGY